VWLLAGFLFTITFNNPGFVIGLFVLNLAMGYSAGLARKTLSTLVLATLVFAAFSTVMWALYVQQGPVLFNVLGNDVTQGGLLFGLAAGMRVGTMISIATIWMSTTSPQRITLGLTRTGLPQTAALAASMGIRFVPMIRGEMVTIMEAQRARGLDFSTRNAITRAKRYGPVLIPLLSRLFVTAQQLALALDAKGFGHPSLRTTLYELQMTRTVWIFVGICIGVEVLGVGLRLAGYGTVVTGLV
jgi:energy-coupling factor transport system permease protein